MATLDLRHEYSIPLANFRSFLTVGLQNEGIVMFGNDYEGKTITFIP